ncbi:MAG: HAD family hydrolase [Lachnospiraceae bacterium]
MNGIDKHSKVKMIACDIDGTLIPYGKTQLPQELFNLIEQLYEKDIHFAIASGRSPQGLQELFAPVSEKMSFICGNGAIYVEQGETVFTQPFQRPYIDLMLEELHKDPNLVPITMCENGYYVLCSGTRAEQERQRADIYDALGESGIEVPEASKIPMPICKLGVYQKQIMTSQQMEALRHRWSGAALVCGGGHWMDVMDRHTNKGTALERILAMHGWNPSNLLAFGDNENDVEMLQLAKYGYVVSNGTKEAKRAAAYECDEVIDILQQLL